MRGKNAAERGPFQRHRKMQVVLVWGWPQNIVHKIQVLVVPPQWRGSCCKQYSGHGGTGRGFQGPAAVRSAIVRRSPGILYLLLLLCCDNGRTLHQFRRRKARKGNSVVRSGVWWFDGRRDPLTTQPNQCRCSGTESLLRANTMADRGGGERRYREKRKK